MGHFEKVLDWLRPLVLGSNWDYCVVWKLGDDPSRFIEWVGCCCNGSGNEEIGNRGKKREKNNKSILDCRDANFVHPANTKSCEALAKLPPFMSLYSGVHGEVVISRQPRWINIAKTADSKHEELEGTLVLIPVIGGLVELFSTKHIPETESIIEYVNSQFNNSETVVGGLVELFSTEHIPENESIIEYVNSQFNNSETETISNSTVTFDGYCIDPLLEKTSDTCLSSLNQLSILPMTQTLTLSPITQTRCDSTMSRSSTGSFPSQANEYTVREGNDRSQKAEKKHKSNPSQANECTVREGNDGNQKVEKKHKSKNLFSERNRRKKNSEGLLTLRSIVPKITKMYKASTLSDAIDYIKELENEAKNLLDELENSDNISYDSETVCLSREIMDQKGNQKQRPSRLTKCSDSQVQVEVNELGIREYLVRVVCQESPGAFTNLIEALASLDALVVDVNSTVCNGTMSSSFLVHTNKEVEEKDFRDLLMLLAV